jgi:hypothetical protein
MSIKVEKFKAARATSKIEFLFNNWQCIKSSVSAKSQYLKYKPTFRRIF